MAFMAFPFPNKLTTSTEKVEKVVNDPQKPVPKSNFMRGDNANLIDLLTESFDSSPFPGGILDFNWRYLVALLEVESSLFKVGRPIKTPRRKDPEIFIPAVCHT